MSVGVFYIQVGRLVIHVLQESVPVCILGVKQFQEVFQIMVCDVITFMWSGTIESLVILILLSVCISYTFTFYSDLNCSL